MENKKSVIVSIQAFKPIAFLTLFGVTVGGILSIEFILDRWIAISEIIIFGFILSQYPSLNSPKPKLVLWMILAQFVTTTLLLQFPEGRNFFAVLFFILSALVGLFYPLRATLSWIAIFCVSLFLSTIQYITWHVALQFTISYAGGYFFFGIVTYTLAKLQHSQWEKEELLLELREKNKQLEEYSKQVEEFTIIQERNHLAREVHDTIGHRLTAASVQLEGAQRLFDTQPDRVKAMLQTIQDQVRNALVDLRQTLNRLRDPVEMDLPIPSALKRLVDSFQNATGLRIHTVINENLELPSKLQITVIRTTQEALTNIQRHAKAKNIWIEIDQIDSFINLKIKDDGIGFKNTPENYGFGLKGLHERAALVNAKFEIVSEPNKGTMITMKIPMKNGEPT